MIAIPYLSQWIENMYLSVADPEFVERGRSGQGAGGHQYVQGRALVEAQRWSPWKLPGLEVFKDNYLSYIILCILVTRLDML